MSWWLLPLPRTIQQTQTPTQTPLLHQHPTINQPSSSGHSEANPRQLSAMEGPIGALPSRTTSLRSCWWFHLTVATNYSKYQQRRRWINDNCQSQVHVVACPRSNNFEYYHISSLQDCFISINRLLHFPRNMECTGKDVPLSIKSKGDPDSSPFSNNKERKHLYHNIF